MTKALELAKFGRESPPAGTVVGDSDTQTLSSKTFSDGPVFSGLTANGVPFLNASKVLSSSATFVFDGTNLGVGVASPAYRFDVQGSGTGIGVARFASNDTSTTTALAIFQRSGGAVSAAIKYNATNSPLTIDFGTTTSHALTFITADTERMRIDASGVIQKPGTNGGLRLMDGNTAGGVKIGSYTSNFLANGYLAFEGYSIEYGRFDSTGNFSIGTQSSDYKLTVARGNESTGQVGLVNFRTEATGSATYNAGVQIFGTASATAANRLVSFVMDADGADAAGGNYFYITKTGGDGRVDLIQASNAPMGFAANYVGRGVIDMTLSAAGNLGLGTTPNTGAKFQVTGYTDFWNTTNTLLRVQHDGSRGKLQSYTGGSVGDIVLNPEGGNVGIGTDNPTFKLDVNARMRVGDGTNNLVIGYWDTATNRIESSGKPLFLTSYTDSIRFGMSGGEQMRLNSNGNLAIGTTANTAQKLNVNGGIWLLGNDDANYSTVIAPRYDSSHPFTIQTRNNDSTLVNWLGIYSDGGGANNRIVLGQGGWPVGIGTTAPATKLDVNGGIRAQSTNNTIGGLIAADSNNVAAKFARITSNGSDVAFGQNIITYPGTWTKADTSAPSGGWVIGTDGAIAYYQSGAGNSNPLQNDRVRIDTSGTLLLSNNQTRKLALVGTEAKKIDEVIEVRVVSQDTWFKIDSRQLYASGPSGSMMDIKVTRLPVHASMVRVYEYRLHQATWDNGGSYYNTLYRVSEKESGWNYYAYTFTVKFYYPTSNLGDNVPLYMKISGFHGSYAYETFVNLTGVVSNYAGNPVLSLLESAPSLTGYSELTVAADY